jgi:hypothetical protein
MGRLMRRTECPTVDHKVSLPQTDDDIALLLKVPQTFFAAGPVTREA